MDSNLSIGLFMNLDFIVLSKKSVPKTRYKDFFLVFSRSFIFIGLTFKSMSPFLVKF